jgi:4-hydroxy-2-oxoheptanedioate aldolase
MVLACRATNMDTMLRRNISGYHDLLQPLEMGVRGFMIPRVRSVDYIKRIVEDVKFPPLGKRGLDGVNADANFGLTPVKDYMRISNYQSFIVAQIEDAEAIPLIDQIAAVEGVDVVFIGQGDMSLSMGITGDVRHPRIVEVMDKVVESCEKHGKTAGVPALNAEDAAVRIKNGFGFFTTGADYRFIKNGLLSLRKDFSSIGFTFRDIQSMEDQS